MPELAYLKIRTISIQVRDTEPTHENFQISPNLSFLKRGTNANSKIQNLVSKIFFICRFVGF